MGGTHPESDLLDLRSDFPILADSTYLLSHSMGAMPASARDSLIEYTEEWGRLGQEAWHKWFPQVMEWGNIVGSLFGAEPDTVVFHQNVSTLMAIVASCLRPEGKRNRVVYTKQNFPTNHYFWQRQAGIEPVRVESPDGITIPTEKMVEAIDDRTLAVLIDHGIYVTGYLQDVEAIVRATQKFGAATIVDAYQTVGVVPFDVKRWGIDYLVGGSHKWLCGGPGASFLYTRPDRLKVSEPRMAGWISAAQPFDFEDDLRYADNAFRFAGGTPGIPGLYAAIPGICLIEAVGVDRIRAKNVRQMTHAMRLAKERGIAVRSPRDPAKRSGLIVLDVPNGAEVTKRLIERRIFCDYRPGAGIRISAHFYTLDEEIETFFRALDGILAEPPPAPKGTKGKKKAAAEAKRARRGEEERGG